MNGGHLLTVMDELRQILSTPIKAYTEDERPSYDDIPSAFTRVLGKGMIVWLFDESRHLNARYSISTQDFAPQFNLNQVVVGV